MYHTVRSIKCCFSAVVIAGASLAIVDDDESDKESVRLSSHCRMHTRMMTRNMTRKCVCDGDDDADDDEREKKGSRLNTSTQRDEGVDESNYTEARQVALRTHTNTNTKR